MGLLQWKRRTQLIDAVVVPASALEDEANPHDLPMHVAMFVNHALSWTAMYAREELPHEALLAAHLSDYVGEVNNGGHAQFVGNTAWDPDMRADIKEGLATLGLDEAARIFADLEAFAAAEPERFAHSSGGADEIDPYFDELDRRFYSPGGQSIPVANTAWIKTRPWLRIMPTEDYAMFPGWVTPPHPLVEARVEALRRRNYPAWRRAMIELYELLHRDKPFPS